MIKLFTSMEEEPLNIEKLTDAEEASNKSSVYDATYQAVKDNLSKKAEEEPEDSSSASDMSTDDNPQEDNESDDDTPIESSDDPVDDDSKDTDVSEEPKEKDAPKDTPDEEPEEEPPAEKVDTSDDTEEGEESKVAKEEMRNFSYPFTVSLEDDYYKEESKLWQGTKGALSLAKDLIVSAGTWLGVLGIQYGPDLFRAVHKSVVFLMTRTIKYLYLGIKNTSVFINRRINSFENLKKEIISIKESIISKEVKNEDIGSSLFTNDKIIDSLVAGKSSDLIKNIETVQRFLSSTVTGLSSNILNDINILKKIIGMDIARTQCSISVLHVKPSSNILKENSMRGYEQNIDVLTSYSSVELLPGTLRLIAHLPNDQIADIERAKVAYSNASMFFGVDSKESRVFQNLHYMTPDQLSSYCDVLIKLCDICLEHKVLYEKVLQSKKGLRYNFKNYFNSLIHSEEKIGLSNSLLEYVYLKSMFVDKVYLAAVMDIHDYCARVVKHSINYIKSNRDIL